MLEKGLDNESVQNKYIKTKIKLYHGKMNTNVQGNEIPEDGVRFSCFSIMSLYSVVKVGKKHYP